MPVQLLNATQNYH